MKKTEQQAITLYRLVRTTGKLEFHPLECRVCPKTYVGPDGRQYPQSESWLRSHHGLYISREAAIEREWKRRADTIAHYEGMAAEWREKLQVFASARDAWRAEQEAS